MQRVFLHIRARFNQVRAHRAFRRYRKFSNRAAQHFSKLDRL